jgi:prepilin-type processing-associated H-X9-DG protein
MGETESPRRRSKCCVWVFLTPFILIGVGLIFLYFYAGFPPKQVWLYLFNPKRDLHVGSCLDNLREMQKALSAYVVSNDRYPPADRWMDEVIQYNSPDDVTRKENWKRFRCPTSTGEDEYGYAMNAELSGALRPLEKDKAEWARAEKTPFIFDSSDTSRNAHGSLSLLPKPGRHDGKNNMLYADGHAASE